MAIVVLAIVVTVNGVIASNVFFLTVHGASLLQWLALEAVILSGAWLVIAGTVMVPSPWHQVR